MFSGTMSPSGRLPGPRPQFAAVCTAPWNYAPVQQGLPGSPERPRPLQTCLLAGPGWGWGSHEACCLQALPAREVLPGVSLDCLLLLPQPLEACAFAVNAAASTLSMRCVSAGHGLLEPQGPGTGAAGLCGGLGSWPACPSYAASSSRCLDCLVRSPGPRGGPLENCNFPGRD